MPKKLLDVLDHHCFHSLFYNLHTHPNRYHCMKDNCPGVISEEMAHKAGHVDSDGNITCPHIRKNGTVCGYATYESGERKVVEVHAKLCTDATIHYPEMHKAGLLSTEDFQAWKSTLTREELLGYYKRVPDMHIVAEFKDDEVDLLHNDLSAFNTLMQQRVRHRAEYTLLYQAPFQHTTQKQTLDKSQLSASS